MVKINGFSLEECAMPFLSRNKLIQILKEWQIIPNKVKGQIFLIDNQICQLIIEQTLKLSESREVKIAVEIGAGLGAFSDGLIAHFPQVVLIEQDPTLIRFLKADLSQHYDVYALKHRHVNFMKEIPLKSPVVLVESDALVLPFPVKAIFVANLPFILSYEIIKKLIITSEFIGAIFIVQQEFVNHLQAQSNRGNYSAISAIAGMFLDVQIIRFLSPTMFYPEPDVDTTVIKISPKPALCSDSQEYKHRTQYIDFVEALFKHKFQKILPALNQLIRTRMISKFDPTRVAEILNYNNLDKMTVKSLPPSTLYALLQACEN
jgi:16S rRNA (adenine1518-N6/adenine1519-N6)-dimethyltransferase